MRRLRRVGVRRGRNDENAWIEPRYLPKRGIALGAILGVLGLAGMFVFFCAVDEAHGHHCKPGTQCVKLKAKYRPCKSLRPRYPRRAKCAINRAAKHYGQSAPYMRSVAYCESTYRWWINGHHEGLFQFLWSTWRSTPFGHRSPYNPKWASMATGWMWTQGRRGEWACA